MFVTFTAPPCTSTSAHWNLRIFQKRPRQTSKAERQKREKRETEETGNRKNQDIIKSWRRRHPRTTKEDFEMATAICRRRGVSPLHHLGDEADDGRGRLVGVQLCKQVTHIVCCASLFSCDEAEEPEGWRKTSRRQYLTFLSPNRNMNSSTHSPHWASSLFAPSMERRQFLNYLNTQKIFYLEIWALKKLVSHFLSWGSVSQ